jgi:hypothetical protein
MNGKNEKDDLTKIAVSFSLYPDTSPAVTIGLANVPRAPLAALIDDLLKEQPGIGIRDTLKSLAALNQGMLEDLDDSAFLSYLVSRINATEVTIKKCARALTTYRKIHEAVRTSDRFLKVAARTEDDSEEIASASDSDILKELRRRLE